MLNNIQQIENDPIPGDEEIEELFSKGKYRKSIIFCNDFHDPFILTNLFIHCIFRYNLYTPLSCNHSAGYHGSTSRQKQSTLELR